MDDDDYDEPVQLPTFSNGSYGGRNANIKAAASRASASKIALLAASRAASLNQFSLSDRSRHSTISNPTKQVVQPVQIKPINTQFIYKTQASIPRSIPRSIPPIPDAIPPAIPPVIPVKKQLIQTSEEYATIVKKALIRKKELLSSFIPQGHPNTVFYPPIQHYEIEDPNINTIDKELFNTMSKNIYTTLTNNPNDTSILDIFNTYSTNLRIFQEKIHHANAIQSALRKKQSYFTSDL